MIKQKHHIENQNHKNIKCKLKTITEGKNHDKSFKVVSIIGNIIFKNCPVYIKVHVFLLFLQKKKYNRYIHVAHNTGEFYYYDDIKKLELTWQLVVVTEGDNNCNGDVNCNLRVSNPFGAVHS